MPRRTTPNPLAQAIGQRIRQLRREQGVTGEKLAYESDVGSKGFLSDIEHGLALPSLTTLERIAQRLEVPLFDLLVIPSQSDRAKVVDLTRHLSKSALTRLLRELDASQRPPLPVPPTLHLVRAYPTLEVAAGWSTPALPHAEPTPEALRLPGRFSRTRDFAVRASGNSMQGFRSTIRDGDWLVMRKVEAAPSAAIGKVVLVRREDKYGDRSLHLKRIVQNGRRLWLRSDDPSVAPVAVAESDTVVASLISVVTPESLAPATKTRFASTQFTAVFGLSEIPTGPWSRVDGHLFLLLQTIPKKSKKRDLPIELGLRQINPRPAETAFVLHHDGDDFEYLGVATFDEEPNAWQLRDG